MHIYTHTYTHTQAHQKLGIDISWGGSSVQGTLSLSLSLSLAPPPLPMCISVRVCGMCVGLCACMGLRAQVYAVQNELILEQGYWEREE